MQKEYLPYLEKEVWIKQEVVNEMLSLRTLGTRQCIYNVYSWAEDMAVKSCDSFDVLRLNPSDPLFSVFFIANHGFVKAAKVRFTTTGVLPDPLLENTDYWIIRVDESMIQVASSELNARGEKPLYLNDQGSGVHTITPNIEAGPWTQFRWVPFGFSNY